MTARALYLVGAPATGKSTTMTALVDRLGLDYGEPYRIHPVRNKQFHGQPLEDIVTGEVRGVALGVARPGGFPGTDALGMAASSEAIAWTQEAEMPELVLGEGRRLGTYRFLSQLAAVTDLTVVDLGVLAAVLAARCAGITQERAVRGGGLGQRIQVRGELAQFRAGLVEQTRKFGVAGG